jgi:hypothetical protein
MDAFAKNGKSMAKRQAPCGIGEPTVAGNHRFPSPHSGQCMEPALLALDPCDPSLIPTRMFFLKTHLLCSKFIFFILFILCFFQDIKIQ